MGKRCSSVTLKLVILISMSCVFQCERLYAQALQGRAETKTAPKGMAFEVISVRPSAEETQRFNAHFTPTGFSARNITPLMIMRLAFGLFNSTDDLFRDVPAWAQSERFDVEAKVGEADTEKYSKLSLPEKLEVLKAMLAESFHLEAVRGVREGKVYLLLPAKGGTKIKASDEGAPPSPAELSRGHIAGHNMPMKSLVSLLTQKFGTTVIDKTGLTGKYDITLNWDPTADEASTTGDGTTIQAALKEQLGLVVQAGTGPVEILTVQHMERPTEN